MEPLGAALLGAELPGAAPPGAVDPVGGAPPGPPRSTPVTLRSLFTRTWTSPALPQRMTWTTDEPSESFIARSTVPGHLVVAAAVSFVRLAPVTAAPI